MVVESAEPGGVRDSRSVELRGGDDDDLLELLAEIGARNEFVEQFAKTALARQMLEFWMYQSATARAIFSPPGVPPDRVEALRRAFDQTVRDQAFLSEMEKLQTVIEPSSGEEVQAAVKAILSTSPEVAAAILDTIK